MRTLLQIRQFAHLRSTTCSLQGLSSTHRSTQTTPSRDLTLGVKAREPPQTISPEVCSSPPGKTERRGTLSGGFATMCEGHRTHGSTTTSFSAPCFKPCRRACTGTSTHAAQTQAGMTQAGTQRHVGLAARACIDTSIHAAQTQARTQHKPPCQAASLKAAVALVGEPFHCPASSAEGE